MHYFVVTFQISHCDRLHGIVIVINFFVFFIDVCDVTSSVLTATFLVFLLLLVDVLLLLLDLFLFGIIVVVVEFHHISIS